MFELVHIYKENLSSLEIMGLLFCHSTNTEREIVQGDTLLPAICLHNINYMKSMACSNTLLLEYSFSY
jgi:hypothetical protein